MGPSREWLAKMADAEDQVRSVSVGCFQEGPTKTAGYQSCVGCCHHVSDVIPTGRSPERHHYCTHPESVTPLLLSFVRPDSAWIGTTDQTPSFCPMLKARGEG